MMKRIRAVQERIDDSVEMFNSCAFIETELSWESLPSWSRFYLNLGAMIASANRKGQRFSAVAVPTRAYAAVFCCGGAVLKCSSVESSLDYQLQFSYLCSLPKGTTVIYRPKEDTKWFGSLLEDCEIDGSKCLVVQIRGSGIIKVPARHALKLDVYEPRKGQLPNRAQKKKSGLSPDLVCRILGARESIESSRTSRLDCLIVGAEAPLREESFAPLMIDTGATGRVKGALGAILKVRRFLPPGEVYRADVLSAVTKKQSAASNLDPTVVIFDGASSFLRWRHFWPTAGKIAILCYSEPGFEDAVAEVNRIALSAREAKTLGVTCPAGTESSGLLLG
jgi:hypothetical protein